MSPEFPFDNCSLQGDSNCFFMSCTRPAAGGKDKAVPDLKQLTEYHSPFLYLKTIQTVIAVSRKEHFSWQKIKIRKPENQSGKSDP